ncbi:hypothetical protein [Klebsiella phage 1 TK-2018]|uniref:Uncharacterized protein n=1 Tax=Klebsiella phage 1 TK-2018 TaxID=2489637 RepID=A0A5K7NLQ1_9CAUD|nr:hypothetical protein [Klebsiella phage 1 TK-2018]UFJ83527.1 hypothetical protein [Klebsiella phage P929]
MGVVTWVKEKYAVYLLLKAEALQARAGDFRVAANIYAARANGVRNEISAHRYNLIRACAKARRKAYTIGAKATATESKAHAFISKHKLKGFY